MISLPVVAIASLHAPDFKIVRRGQPALAQAMDLWQKQIDKTAPADAYRVDGVVQIWSIEAINQPPWWRCQVVKVDGVNGLPVPDPEEPDRYLSMFFRPIPSPPPELVEALDEMSGHKLSKRFDGGPQPTNGEPQ